MLCPHHSGRAVLSRGIRERGFGRLEKTPPTVFVKHVVGSWHTVSARHTRPLLLLLLIILLLFLFPPGNQHFSSFLQSSDGTRLSGPKYRDRAGGPGAPGGGARGRRCALPSSLRTRPSPGAGRTGRTEAPPLPTVRGPAQEAGEEGPTGSPRRASEWRGAAPLGAGLAGSSPGASLRAKDRRSRCCLPAGPGLTGGPQVPAHGA